MTVTTNSYGLPAILFHWISAVLIVGLFALGIWMVDLSYYSEWYRTAPHWHKSVGLILAVFTLLRLGYRVWRGAPSPNGNAAQKTLAKLTHVFLYLLLLALFISGYLISTADGRGIDVFNWLTIPSLGALIERQEDIAGWLHEYIAYALMMLTSLHVLAALKHHFIDRDDTLLRMFKSDVK